MLESFFRTYASSRAAFIAYHQTLHLFTIIRLVTQMLNKWKKSIKGQWSSVCKQLASAPEEQSLAELQWQWMQQGDTLESGMGIW
jgi:hypothetical protein